MENNRIAQTTPIELAVAGSIQARFTAFGIPAIELDTSDVLEIHNASNDLLREVRESGSPRTIILHTYRFGPHSKGDDTRLPEEIARYRQQRDPIRIQSARLDERLRREIEGQVNQQVSTAFAEAQAEPYPVIDSFPDQ
jgi:TPP-dependent pyruvate/acetoin dehydrogenase alpha subunit